MKRNQKYKVLDLFSGIGGFSLGLERAGGFETIAFCENDEPCQRVLRKHWPDTPIFPDVTELNSEELYSQGIKPDLICGGFPCTDISTCGRGVGIHGEKSSLWHNMFLLIRDVRPEWAIIENVPALRHRGLTLVLQNLSSLSYVCEVHCIPAYSLGAPHVRDRLFILAHSASGGQSGPREFEPSSDSKTVLKRETIDAFNGRFKEIWATEPQLGRVVDGIPDRMDRLTQLGNSMLPQIPEMIGTAIMEFDDAEKSLQI